MSAAVLSQLSSSGSDVRLFYRVPGSGGQPSTVQSAPYKLFLRCGSIPQYGRAGTIFWAPVTASGQVASLDESNTSRRFALASISDMRANKQSAVFRSPVCDSAPAEVCFSLASSQYELNLQFSSKDERELWWSVILSQLEQNGRKLLQDSAAGAGGTTVAASGAASSASAAAAGAASAPKPSQKLSLQQAPAVLAGILAAGSPFRKFDLAPSGSLSISEVIVFTSGIGRAGLLHWVAAASVPAGQAPVPVPGDHIPLGKITDILMRKKSAALKSVLNDASVKEDACFALVTEAYTLSLEARSKEQRTQWQEGLISILTNAGKQLQRKSGGSDAAGGSPPSVQRRPSSFDHVTPAMLASRVEETFLSTGLPFNMYFLHPPHSGNVVRQWAFIWFVEATPPSPDAPGFLYFSTHPTKREQHADQRFPLHSITEMAGSNKVAPVWKLGSAATTLSEHCATIMSHTMAWNVEVLAPAGSTIQQGKELRDAFLKNIHAVMMKFRRREALAAMALQGGSPTSASAIGVASPQASPSASPQVAAAQRQEELRMLTEGQSFVRHTVRTPGGHDLQAQSITLWFAEESATTPAPGVLYFTNAPGAKVIGPDTGRLWLANVQSMAAGKESALFKLPTAKSILLDRCMSIVSAALTLDLEAPAFEVREKWIRALHGVMVRHGRKAVEQRAAASAGMPPSPISSSGPSSSPFRGSVSGSPTSASSSSAAAGSASLPFVAISAAPLPTPDAQVAQMQQGFPLVVLYATPNGTVLSADITLFLLIAASNTPAAGAFPELNYATASLQWCAAGQKKVDPAQRMLLSGVVDVRRGKDASLPCLATIWKSELSKVQYKAERCINILGDKLTLTLVAGSDEGREVFLAALEHVLAKARAVVPRLKMESAAAFSAAASAAALASPPLSRAGSSPSASPAAAVTAVPELETPAQQAAFLAAPQRFNLFTANPRTGAEERTDVVVWVTPPSDDGESSGHAHWVSYGSKMDPRPEQTLYMDCIDSAESATEASPDQTAILRSALAKASKVDLDACLIIVHSTPTPGLPATLYLEAPSRAQKDAYLKAFQGTVERITLDRQRTMYNTMIQGGGNSSGGGGAAIHATTQLEAGRPSSIIAGTALGPMTPGAAGKGSQHPNPMSPNSPASPNSNNAAAAPVMDHKVAVALLTTGQPFVLYSHAGGGSAVLTEERMENVFLFFIASNGVDSPGTLHYTRIPPPGQEVSRVVDKSKTFYLNQIKQMRAGKETPIFKNPSGLAAHANPSRCLSLFSVNTTWNLEAPSAEVRETWMKSLHQVLVRHGMKAVDDAKKAAASPTPAAAAAAAPAAKAAAGHAPNSSYHAALANVAANPGLGGPAPSSPSSASGGGFGHESRPLPSTARDASISRTINFSDPTDYFVLEAKIGEGSYGAVYKALDMRDRKHVAIKVLQFQGRDSLKLRKEIHILKQCDSSYIVGYKGAFQKASNVWIVMEYCAAGSLSDIMQICNRTFSEAQIACIMKHALAGLAYLHSEKKIHRDIKGGNILVDNMGACKLADFGVSSNLDKTLGKNRTVIGTPHWMAPEVLTNDDYDARADVWSLGITAYELAIGEPPHAKLHSMRAAIKIPTSPPPTLPDPHRFSADFHAFLAACLVKDFEARPSAASLLSHPFIQKAPRETILMENVRLAMEELESKHESMEEISNLMNQQTIVPKAGGTGTAADRRSLRGLGSTNRSSGSALQQTADLDDIDGDFGGSDTMRPLSDTMVPGGGGANDATMVMGSTAPGKVLPSSSGGGQQQVSDTMLFGTIVPQQQAQKPSATSPAHAAAAAAVAAAASAASADDDLAQFDDSDDENLEAPRIVEEPR